jgi:1,4-dihydroxy-2-naphthoyl-CoA hydrolase
MRIRLNDIDAAGVAFGPHLIALAHEAVEDALRAAGLDFAAVLREGAYALPLVRIESDFKAPVRHGDDLEPTVTVVKRGERSFTLKTVLQIAGGPVAVEVVQTHVALDPKARAAVALPAAVVTALERLG